MSAYATSVADSVISGAEPIDGPALESGLNETIEKSVEELDKWLGSDWREKCGLVKEVSTKGEIEWVLEKYAAEFKDKGADFIRETYRVKKDTKEKAVAIAQKELKEIKDDNSKRTRKLQLDTTNFDATYDNLSNPPQPDPSPKDETRLTRPSRAALMACCNNSTCYCAIA